MLVLYFTHTEPFKHIVYFLNLCIVCVPVKYYSLYSQLSSCKLALVVPGMADNYFLQKP